MENWALKAILGNHWQTANRLPWGVLILIGGGMSFAAAMNASGLNALMADQLLMLKNLPTILLISAVVAITIFLTEITSNTATIAALLPVLLGGGAFSWIAALCR